MSIYFIQEELTRNIKIGYSSDEISRKLNLQTSNSSHLKILTAIPGDKATESKLHQEYIDLNIHGEWFNPGERLLKDIKLFDRIFCPFSEKKKRIPLKRFRYDTTPYHKQYKGKEDTIEYDYAAPFRNL